MALRTGYSVPLGSVTENLSMSDSVSGQVPILIDIGGKPIPNLFVGGYLGLGFGGVAGATKPVGSIRDQCAHRISRYAKH
jgi:hypothetical protein